MTATKATPTKHSEPKPITRKVVEMRFPDPPDKDAADALAKFAVKPSVNAAVVMAEYTKVFGEQDLGALMATLTADIEALQAGDMKKPEAMLFAQAQTLQSIFMNLARRATSQQYMNHWEAFLRMALKAQSQCRATLEALATIKNPPVVFAQQANINQGGQQQVNNGAAPASALPSAALMTGGHEMSGDPASGTRTAPHAENFSRR